jgi:hypothetical protein
MRSMSCWVLSLTCSLTHPQFHLRSGSDAETAWLRRFVQRPCRHFPEPARFREHCAQLAPKSARSPNHFRQLRDAPPFWDLDDAWNEAGAEPAISGVSPDPADDVSNKNTVDIINGWTTLSVGTRNRQNQEAGWCGNPALPCDPNGVNMWDYVESKYPNSPLTRQTLFAHNCLSDQELH